MKHSFLKKLHGSIFMQLLLVIFLTGVAVIFVVGLFFRLVSHQGKLNPYQANMQAYAHYLIDDLGSPPDLDKAKQLARSLYVEMRYKGPLNSWTTSPDLISFETADKLHPRHRRGHRSHFIIIDHQRGRFLFQPNFKTALTINPWAIIGLIVGLGLMFFMSWLWIRWILKPLTLLNNGVQQLAQGNLNHQIPLTRKDELGQLAHSFNHMTRQLRDMIKSKDHLLLDITHELRSPLTRIKLALELIKNKSHKAIEDDVLEMEHLINQILDAGKLENINWQPKKKWLSVTQVFDHNQLKNYCQPTELTLSIADEIKELLIDPDQFKLVLSNLLENASNHTPSPGQAIELLVEKMNATILISIIDHGNGIPAEYLGLVFEPFYRVDQSRSRATGGFGLGLSICKRIIEAHGGTIEIESTLTVGTKVIIKLPLA